MELTMRNNKKKKSFFDDQKGMIFFAGIFLLVMFTLGFKIQYVALELKSLITQNGFVEDARQVRTVEREEVLVNEGVIIRDPQQSIFQNYIIEFNPETQIGVGDAVIRRGSLMGLIEKTNGRFAVVANITRSGYVIDGIIPTGEVITLNGRGDGDFSALVPRDYEVDVGDVVRSVRHHEVVLGDVIDIKFDTRDVYKRVYVRSRIRNGILEKVTLIKEENPF